jgi:hypothetical protein
MNRLSRRIARGPWSGLAVALASLLAVACVETDEDIANGDDPLRALTVAHRSDRYGSTYWTQKSSADSALWAQAVAYCEGRADGDHPNCDAVRQVQVLEGMSDMPEDRPNDFRLTVPQDSSRDDMRR